MYFTSVMRDAKETAEQSPCVRFARDFLPVVNKALEEVYSEPANADANSSAAATDAAKPKADGAKTAAKSAGESATSEKTRGAESAAPATQTKP